MKNLKLLNRNFFKFLFIFFLLYFKNVYSNEPVDIWNLEKEKIKVYPNPDDKNIFISGKIKNEIQIINWFI